MAIRCVIRGALEPPSYVMWYFGAEQIFSDNKFGWDMRTDEGDSHSTVSGDKQESLCPLAVGGGWDRKLGCARDVLIEFRFQIASLIIPAAKKQDSGNFTCNPSNSDSVTVLLHVINGENDNIFSRFYFFINFGWFFIYRGE